MSKNRDYIPWNDLKLIEWVTRFLVYIFRAENCLRWGILEPSPVLQELFQDFTNRHTEVQLGVGGAAKVKEKNVAKAKMVKAIRNFAQGYLARNINVTESDRIAMGLQIYDNIPTVIPVPVTQVEGTLAFRGLGLIEIRDIRPAADKPDARAGHGVRIYYGIMGESPSENASDKFRLTAAPEHGSDLPHSVFTRKRRHLFDFTKNRGKAAYFCMRYENSKGEAGPWGKIYEAFIP